MRCFPDLEAKRRVLLQVCNRILSYHIPFLAASYSSSVSSSSYFISFVVTAVLSSSYSSSSSMSSPLPLPLPPLLHALIHHLNPQRLVLITLGRQRSSILAFFLLLRVCGEDEVYNGGQGGGEGCGELRHSPKSIAFMIPGQWQKASSCKGVNPKWKIYRAFLKVQRAAL